jgi:hypothetical protein
MWVRTSGSGSVGPRLETMLTPSMAGLISLYIRTALGVSEQHSGCHIFCEVGAEAEETVERRTYIK